MYRTSPNILKIAEEILPNLKSKKITMVKLNSIGKNDVDNRQENFQPKSLRAGRLAVKMKN